jgi:sarcosine oxidase subunit alpha
VTSAYWSETLHRPIALALLSGGRSRTGDALYVPMANRTIAVRVTDPVFYDKPGRRLDG